jgi:hypothetical protein
MINSSATSQNLHLKCFDDFHISLTKTVILKHHWIDSFIDTLKENISYFNRYKFKNITMYKVLHFLF